MDLLKHLESRKKITHNSPLRNELFNRVRNFGIIDFQEAKYFVLHKLTNKPKCKYSNSYQFFNGKEYVGCAKEYYNYIKHDKYVKNKWLTWDNLFSLGLSLKEANQIKESNSLKRIRLLIKPISNDKIDILNSMIKLGFNSNIINHISQYNFNDINDIIKVINYINIIISYRNVSIRYYLARYDKKDAVLKYSEHFNTWEKFSKSIDVNSERYNNWLDSRQKGIKSNNIKSKFEKEIYEKLNNKFKINTKFITNINDSNFSQHLFRHDFVFNNKLIVEYNGSYWHNDIYCNRKFGDKGKYMIELIKANLCIEENNLKYLILWESDINHDMSKVEELINNALKANNRFFSSRNIDIKLYNESFESNEMIEEDAKSFI